MLKKNAFKRILISTLALFILLFLYLFPVNNKNNIEEEISYIDAIKMPIYLSDKNNYVARIDILKSSEEVLKNIKNIISTLTINSAESSYLPDGFKAVIPENTKINELSLDENILKIDFSKEFLNYEKDNELIIFESLIFSLCEFKEVEEIMIFIDGIKLNKLPYLQKDLPNTLDKSFGINKIYDITSFKGVDMTINYYISKTDNLTYYIPISKYENSSNEKIEIIIENLKTSPINQTNLISYLKASANLESYEIMEETINLSFDNNLLADLSSNNIIEEVKYSIYLSIRDTYNIKSVIFELPNEENVSVLLD